MQCIHDDQIEFRTVLHHGFQFLDQAVSYFPCTKGSKEPFRRSPPFQDFILPLFQPSPSVLQRQVQCAPFMRPIPQKGTSFRNRQAQVEHHPAFPRLGGRHKQRQARRKQSLHDEFQRRELFLLQITSRQKGQPPFTFLSGIVTLAVIGSLDPIFYLFQRDAIHLTRLVFQHIHAL